LGAVVIERCEATLKLGSLGRVNCTCGHPGCPKAARSRQAVHPGQAGDFVMSELHWFRLAEPTVSVDFLICKSMSSFGS
jgi:hypothetical protein